MHLRRALNHFLGRDAAPMALALSQPRIEARDPAITLISIIYSTAPKTFTGDAIYVTQTIPIATPTPTPTPVNDDDLTTSTTSRRASSIPVSSANGSGSGSGSSTASFSSSNTLSSSASSSISSANQASATADSTVVASTQASTGMTGGAKAGIAFGVILGFAIVGVVIFFFLKRRQRKVDDFSRVDDEKAFFDAGRNPDSLPSHPIADTASSETAVGGMGGFYNEKASSSEPAQTDSTFGDRANRFSYEEVQAPRLSLRGVSQFGPMGNLNNGDIRMSGMSGASSQVLPPAGAAALAAAGGLGGAAALGNRNRSNTATNNDPNNPFGNHAEKLATSPTQDKPSPLTSNLDAAGRKSPSSQATNIPLPDSTPGTPTTSKPSSPLLSKATAGTGAVATGAAAIAAATAAAASYTPQGGPVSENVYRVQLDFKPSMDDELDIAAGQLVRCLHEYDDGWALCIRMDRSKQGVVPRTCLSKHPVKPRPASPGQRGPPPPRGAPPPGIRNPASGSSSPGPRSMSPAPARALTPTGGRDRSGNNAPYAQSPIRSQSPGPHGGSRLRSESNAQSSGLRNAQTPPANNSSPAGATPAVARKPVGGS